MDTILRKQAAVNGSGAGVDAGSRAKRNERGNGRLV
jgi:hypothetical protein